jgi:hypothetical protein
MRLQASPSAPKSVGLPFSLSQRSIAAFHTEVVDEMKSELGHRMKRVWRKATRDLAWSVRVGLPKLPLLGRAAPCCTWELLATGHHQHEETSLLDPLQCA